MSDVDALPGRSMRLDSYFTFDTDLAALFRSWPEWRGGSGFDVDLASGEECVSIRHVDSSGDEPRHVLVRGSGDGPLFHRVLGTTIHAMSAHTDNLTVGTWWMPDEEPRTP